jgi:hypothetical protein
VADVWNQAPAPTETESAPAQGVGVQSARVGKQSTPAEDSFFSDAAFIGNSLIDGFRMYSGLTTCDYYAATSMTVMSAAGSVLEKLGKQKYGKIYILLGINEIGYDSFYFKKQYLSFIDSIAAIQPGADIYIMGIMPVSAKTSDTSPTFTMDRIRTYNERLLEVADEKGCHYIDLCEALAGPDGYLPSDATWDGIHLNMSYYKVWLEYLRYYYA